MIELKFHANVRVYVVDSMEMDRLPHIAIGTLKRATSEINELLVTCERDTIVDETMSIQQVVHVYDLWTT